MQQIIGILSVVACIYELEKFTEGSTEHREKLVQLASVSLLALSSFVGCLGAINGSVRILSCVSDDSTKIQKNKKLF